MNNQVGLSDDEDDPDDRPEVNAGPPAEICAFNTEDPEIPALFDGEEAGPPAEICAFNTEDPEIPALFDGEEASRSLFDQGLVLVPFDSPPLLHCSGVKLPILRPYAGPMAVLEEVQEAVLDEIQEAVPDEIQDDVAVAVKEDVAVVAPLPNAAPVSDFIQMLYQALMDSLDDSTVSNLINWVDEYHFEVKDEENLANAYFPSINSICFEDLCAKHHFEGAAQPNVWRHQTEFFRMGKPELLEQIVREQIVSEMARTPKDEGTSGQANLAQDLEGVRD